MTNHTEPVTQGAGGYNTLAISFEDDRNTYQALTLLGELDSQGRVAVQEAVIVTREADGQVVEQDRVEPTPLAATAGGGLIGLLVGIIGGPFGMLLGGMSGLLVGSLFDLTDMDDTDSALARLSASVRVGHTTLLAVISEQNAEIVDSAMASLGGTVVRRPVDQVQAEIAAAEAAERKAKRDARRELVQTRQEQTKATAVAKVEELKRKLHAVR